MVANERTIQERVEVSRDLTTMIAQSEGHDARKTDSVVAACDVKWIGRSASFQLGAESVWGNSAMQEPLPLKLHAFRQVCSKLGAAVWAAKVQRS